MSFVKNPSIIFARMREKGIRFYQVFDSDNKTVIDETDDENISVDESIRLLTETLENLEGMVHVVIRVDGAARKRKAASDAVTGSGDAYKGIFKYSLKVGDAKADSSSGGGFSNSKLFDFAMNAMREKHEAEMASIRAQTELEKRLNEKIEKLEKKNSGSNLPPNFDKLIETLITKLGGSL